MLFQVLLRCFNSMIVRLKESFFEIEKVEYFSFNSMIVRLKESINELKPLYTRRFNSMIVRLKGSSSLLLCA